MPSPTPVMNDNNACVIWSHNLTTKGLRHVQIRENAIRESIEAGFVSIHHIEGASNLADFFTKEDKCVEHFCKIQDTILTEVQDDRIVLACQSQGGVISQGGTNNSTTPSSMEPPSCTQSVVT